MSIELQQINYLGNQVLHAREFKGDREEATSWRKSIETIAEEVVGDLLGRTQEALDKHDRGEKDKILRNMILRKLSTRLTGDAGTWHAAYVKPGMEWEDWWKAFELEFQPQYLQDELEERFSDLRMERGEGIGTFVLRIRGVVEKLRKEKTEDEIKAQMWKGVPEGIRSSVRLHTNNQPLILPVAELSEKVRLVMEEKGGLLAEVQEVSRVRVDEAVMERGGYVRQGYGMRQQGMRQQWGGYGQRREGKRECFACGEIGHLMYYCIVPCPRCSRTGHNERGCDADFEACSYCRIRGHRSIACPKKPS